jgi:hypothetical protein
MRLSPFERSSRAIGARSVPFVVIDRSFKPCTVLIPLMMFTMSSRIKGSPPVNLTLHIPKLTAILTIRDISSAVISCLGHWADSSPSPWQ